MWQGEPEERKGGSWEKYRTQLKGMTGARSEDWPKPTGLGAAQLTGTLRLCRTRV